MLPTTKNIMDELSTFIPANLLDEFLELLVFRHEISGLISSSQDLAKRNKSTSHAPAKTKILQNCLILTAAISFRIFADKAA